MKLADQLRPAEDPGVPAQGRAGQSLAQMPVLRADAVPSRAGGNLHVCRRCGHHFRIGSQARFKLLFDGGEFDPIEPPQVAPDPLRFRDRKRYTERLRENQAALGRPDRNDALAVAEGRIGGIAAVVAAFDFAFMGGSMGMAVGEALVAAARRAVEREAALIVVPASGGARMQEGILSLMQMPRTILAADMVKEAGLPYIVVLTDPTTGGVSASFAMLGDIILAEPGAIIGFAGARVIQETIRETSARAVPARRVPLEHGMVDQVVPRAELAATLGRVLRAAARAAPGRGRRRMSCCSRPPDRGRRQRRMTQLAAGKRPGPDPADAAAPEKDRPDARPCRAAAGRARQPAGQTAAGHPCRRDQRQGLDGRDDARLPRSRRIPGARLYLAASRALSRAHPARRRTDRRGRAARGARRMRARQSAANRSHFSRSRPPRRFSPSRARRPISCCSKPGSAAGSTRPMLIRRPAATAITPISLDHQAFLGDTVAAIAGEKAGILKPGAPAVIGPQPDEAAAVIEARARRSRSVRRFHRWRCAGDGASRGPGGEGERHALRGRTLAARPAAAVAAGRAPDRQCRDRAGLPRTSRRVRAAGERDRGGSAPYRLAGADAAPDPRPARRDPAARLGIVARRRPQSRRRAGAGRGGGGVARPAALSRRRHAQHQGCRAGFSRRSHR